MGREWRRKVLKCEKCHSMEDENITSRALYSPICRKKTGNLHFKNFFITIVYTGPLGVGGYFEPSSKGVDFFVSPVKGW